MADLVADAISDHDLVPHPTRTQSVVNDLCSLLKAFTSPMTVAERAAAALIGPARTNLDVAAALHAAIVDPLHAALGDILRAHTAPGTAGTDTRERLMRTVVLALWWDRYITTGPILTPDQLRELVTRCLLPTLQCDRA